MGRRIRTVKPEFFTNEDVQSVPADVRYTLIGLFFYADDYGRAPANLGLMRSSIFPLDEDLTVGVLETHLYALAEAKHPLIQLYDVDGRSYLRVSDWDYWQRIDRPTASRLPAPPEEPLARTREDSRTDAKVLVGEGREAGGEEGAQREGQGGAPSRVTFQALDDLPPSPFCAKHPNDTDDPCWGCKRAKEKHNAWLENPPPRQPVTISLPPDDDDYDGEPG